MTVTRRLARVGSLAGLVGGLLAYYPAAAGQVAIFDGTVPQPSQLANILWPDVATAGRPYGLTRSIRLSVGPAPPAPTAAPGPVQMAAAQPEAGPQQGGGPDAFGFRIRFAFNSAEVLPESRPYLDSVGQMLRLPQAQGRRVLIVGHTDALGGEAYNQALSERRAATVRAYLAGRFGIPADLLLVEGEGKREPLPGLDPRAPQNRRVEFHAAG
jgi:outer membrane protein OmpA-like peptidoglycan-associated protein